MDARVTLAKNGGSCSALRRFAKCKCETPCERPRLVWSGGTRKSVGYEKDLTE